MLLTKCQEIRSHIVLNYVYITIEQINKQTNQ
jgi:hypothetical protein